MEEIRPDNNLYIVIGEVVSEFDETAIQTLTQNYVNSTIVDGRAGILRITLDGNLVLDRSKIRYIRKDRTTIPQ